jgi:hypothetical protein
MSSIFIWKSAEKNNSKTLVRFYSGGNWFLQENETVSRSFLFDDQEVITGSTLSDTVILFTAKEMRKDWVGTELLEVTQLPYKLIKSDDFGTLEMVGDWLQFISNSNAVTVEKIYEWMQLVPEMRSGLDFNTFLIKYDTTKRYQPHKKHNGYKKMQRGFQGRVNILNLHE